MDGVNDPLAALKGDKVKAQISFKKGIIAAVLLMVLLLCVGLLIGYSLGINIATDHYTKLLLECQNRTMFLW